VRFSGKGRYPGTHFHGNVSHPVNRPGRGKPRSENLRLLCLALTAVSREGLASLKTALPNCEIITDRTAYMEARRRVLGSDPSDPDGTSAPSRPDAPGSPGALLRPSPDRPCLWNHRRLLSLSGTGPRALRFSESGQERVHGHESGQGTLGKMTSRPCRRPGQFR